jgi:branched-chain amino acid transport system substrate-binding protein
MTRISRRVFALSGASSVLLATPSIARAQKKYDPGVTDTEIKLGHTNPYSGPASAYGVIGNGISAYWKMVNDTGGINGRKVNFISYDDSLSPPKAVEMVRKLVEEDKVFAIFQLLGTSGNTVVQKYLNQRKVPQLFTGSGASKFGDPKSYPWTMGWQPDYATESGIYAKDIMTNHKDAKIGILYTNDDSGRDYLEGFKKALGPDGVKQLVAAASAELTDPTVESQIIQIKAAGVTAFYNSVGSKQAAQAIRKAADLAWKPAHYLANVSSSVAGTLKPAGLENCKGLITAQYLKDPTDPQWAHAPDYVEWKAWMAKYLPQGNVADYLFGYAYAVSATMRHVLLACGNDLSRENLMKQAASMKDVTIPMLLPGITLNTSATDYYPIKSSQLARFDGDTWRLYGDVISYNPR